MMENSTHNKYLTEAIKDIFVVSLISYLFSLAAENFFEGIVSNFIRLDYFLYFVIIFGVLTIILYRPNKEETMTELKKYEYFIILVISLIVSLLIYFQTRSLGWFSLLVSVAIFFLSFLISLTLIKEKEND